MPITATAPNGVWDYGIYDAGINGGNYQETSAGNPSTQSYSLAGVIQPSTFDTFGANNNDGGPFVLRRDAPSISNPVWPAGPTKTNRARCSTPTATAA